VHRREALIRVLSELKVPERELVAPVRNEIEVAYSLALERCPLEHLSASQARDFLLEAIQEGVKERVRAALRLLRAAGPGREMDLINRSVFSEDRHTASIALEGLERMVQKEISRLLVPLIEERPTREVQSKAWGAFGLRPPSLEELLNRYLDSQDPVFQIGAKALLLEAHEAEAKGDGGLGALAFKDISSALLARLGGEAEKVSWMRDALSILEKVVFLRRVELFSALDVRALAAIATIAQERTLEPGEILCSEGEPGDSMFCIVEGQVEVLKSHPQGSGAKLAEVGSPEVLGEMALFDEKPRSATLKAGEKSTVLVIPRGAFLEIMREYPQVGISALKILSRRLREAGLRDLRPDGFVAPGERRRFPRVRVDMGVLVDRGQRVSLLNISQAGAYWEEDQPRIPGQRVSLEIEFPGRGSICLMGRVQRCQRLGHREGFGMAVVFEPMEGETERMFHEWLEAQGAGKSRA
jgi:CRP-like cAMP-binding protein